MKTSILGQKKIREIFFSFFILILISISTGIFLFDKNLLVYNRVVLDKIKIYTNFQNSSLLFKYTGLSFFGIGIIIFIFSLILHSKKRFSHVECFYRETITFFPLLFFPLARLFFGKAAKFIIIFPLYPLLLFLIVGTIIHLNLNLHFNLDLIRRGFFFIKPCLSRKKTQLIAISLVFMTILIFSLSNNPHFQRFSSHRLFLGDEPKYMRMAYSLVVDKNLDVSNEFVIEEGLEETKKRILASGSRRFGDLSIIGLDGRIYHIHMPGLSLLISPFLHLDILTFPNELTKSQPYPNLKKFPSKLIFTRLGLLIIGIMTIFFFARLVYRFFNSLTLLAILLLLYIFSSPVPKFMTQLYPETAACLLTLIVFNALMFPFKTKYLNESFIILGIGFLPWLHQRFILIAAGLYLVLIVNEIFYRKNYKKFFVLTFFLFIVSLPYFTYFYSITGNPMPNSISRLFGTSFMRFSMFPLGFFGQLFDYSRGMIWLFPWTALALIGIYWALKRERKRASMLLLIIAPYYMFTCFHIAWHGMAKEPGRYLVAIIPFLLLFFGYTIKDFLKRPNYLQLFLYVAIPLVIFLNKKFWFLFFDFGGSYITHTHTIQIIQCSIILVVTYSSFILSDILFGNNSAMVPKKKVSNYLRNSYSKINTLSISKNKAKAPIYLIILIFVAYLPVYLKNWDDKTLSLSLLGTLNKMKSFDSVVLTQRDDLTEASEKGDKSFIKLFKNTYHFSIDSSQKNCKIHIEKSPFYTKVPSGCYRIQLAANSLVDENMNLELFFLGEKKVIRFEENSGNFTAVANFILFEDRFVSPFLELSSEGLQSEQISGNLEIYPVPYLISGKTIILRPIPVDNPNPVRKKGKNQYNLAFLVNTSKPKTELKFFLYTLKTPDKINKNKETLLASRKEIFLEKGQPYRVNIGFSFPSTFLEEKSGLALFVQDENDRTLNCKSLWLSTQKKFWALLKSPKSSTTRIFF